MIGYAGDRSKSTLPRTTGELEPTERTTAETAGDRLDILESVEFHATLDRLLSLGATWESRRMSSQFWTRTAAAIAMAMLPLGLYHLVQNVPGIATGFNLLAIVILLFGAILALIAWVGQNANLEPATAE